MTANSSRMHEPRRYSARRDARADGPGCFARLVNVAVVVGLAASGSLPAAAQDTVSTNVASPFRVGEDLRFEVHTSRFGEVGAGRMRVEGPTNVRGTETFVFSMDVEGRVMLFGFSDRTRSWYDPASGASLRFHKEEQHPLARSGEAVEVLPDEGRWEAADGAGGRLPTDRPLDELSFIYHVRTLDYPAGGEGRQHFDAARNPVEIRFVERTTVTVPAGTFEVIVVDLQVRDPRRFGSDVQAIRIHLTDDRHRVPVRIESSAPMVGRLELRLEWWRPGNGRYVSAGRETVARHE